MDCLVYTLSLGKLFSISWHPRRTSQTSACNIFPALSKSLVTLNTCGSNGAGSAVE
jgi:hypothetical protein